MYRFADRIHSAINTEIQRSRAAESRGEFHTAFSHLERAHVLGQWSTVQHVRMHWLMLRFALRNRLASEVAGQMWRVAAAAVFTSFGLLPSGNSGGANVSGFQPLAISADLQRVIDTAE